MPKNVLVFYVMNTIGSIVLKKLNNLLGYIDTIGEAHNLPIFYPSPLSKKELPLFTGIKKDTCDFFEQE